MDSLDLVALLRYLRMYHLSLGMTVQQHEIHPFTLDLIVQLGHTFFNETLKNYEFLSLQLSYESVKLNQEIEDFKESFAK